MTASEGVVGLRAAVSALLAEVTDKDVRQRLADSVLRPLDGIADDATGTGEPVAGGIWELALRA